MTQPTPVDPAQPTPQPQQQPPGQVPPWERDGATFDPQRAWTLIQNKDNDIAVLKAKNAELAAYEAQVKATEEANKTELQRAQDALAASQKAEQDARLALLRRDVAGREGKQLPAVLVDVLRGNTKEELEAHADALLAGLPQAPAPPVGASTTPVSALRPGALPQPPAASLAEQIATAEAAKDWSTARLLKAQQLMGLHQPQ